MTLEQVLIFDELKRKLKTGDEAIANSVLRTLQLIIAAQRSNQPELIDWERIKEQYGI